MNHRDAGHGLARRGQIFVILGEAAIAAQPRQGPLHNPPLRQELEALGALEPLHNLEPYFPPGPQRRRPGDEVASIRLIRPDEVPAGELVPEDVQQVSGPIAVLHTSSRDHDGQEQPERIDEDRALAAVDGLVRIVPVDPPFSVVLTD